MPHQKPLKRLQEWWAILGFGKDDTPKTAWKGWETEHERRICSAEELNWASLSLEIILRRWRLGRGYDKETLHQFSKEASKLFDHVTYIVYQNEVIE